MKYSITILVTLIIGFFLGKIHHEYDIIHNKTSYVLGGWYRQINEKDYVSGSHRKGLYYCEITQPQSKQLPVVFPGGYAQIDEIVFLGAKQITTCKNNCIFDEEVIGLLHDGDRTWYNGVELVDFNYDKLVITDPVESIFTDGVSIYRKHEKIN